MVVFGVSINIDVNGMVKEVIPYQYGRELLLKDYQAYEFLTDVWDSDITLMVPYVFKVKGKGWFVLCSFAGQSDSSGTGWQILGLGEREFKLDRDLERSVGDLLVDPDKFYIVTDRLGNKRLCFYLFRDQRAMHPKYEVWLNDYDWWELTAGEGRLEKRQLFQGGIGSFFKEKDFKSIRLVEFHQYRGPKAEKVTYRNEKGRWIDPQTLRKQGRFSDWEKYHVARRLEAAKETRPNWELSPEKVRQLLECYRKMAAADGRKVGTIYYVLCDVDADGKCDSYVASDAGKPGGGLLQWNLLLGTESGFSPLRETRQIPRKIKEMLYLDPVVRASTNDFYRIERMRQPGYVLITEKNNRGLESWAYLHHDSPIKSFRSNPEFAKASLSSIHDSTTDVTSLDDLTTPGFTYLVEAERLQCHSITLENESEKMKTTKKSGE